jgi:high-affinity iron transporter
MLVNSVILVLREVLEAAILVSVLVALSLQLRLGLRWLCWALPVALVGALWYAGVLDDVTDALDGAGQEVANATLQFLVYLLVLGVVALSGGGHREAQAWHVGLRTLMALAVVFAVVREGAEIAVYVEGFAAAEALRRAVFAGSVIGGGIGISSGVLLLAALRALPGDRRLATCLLLLCLIGAGMIMQATMLLEQVDWLLSGEPLWDSSGLLSEQSVSGELLYAVFGYEATPGVVQVALYLVSLMLMLALWWSSSHVGRKNHVV